MKGLIHSVNIAIESEKLLPFSAYKSIKEQQIFNVTTFKPLLIVVLKGTKKIGSRHSLICHSGDFVFLSYSYTVSMRNIPKQDEYFALLIEFEPHHFDGLPAQSVQTSPYFSGVTTALLETCLCQFVEWSMISPDSLWDLRKKELIQVIYQMGYQSIQSMALNTSLGHKVFNIVKHHRHGDVPMSEFCRQLAMSESSIRRKLKLEGVSIQYIKDQVRLGNGLHLLQTTSYPIGLIAEKCGYRSPSKFSDRFKGQFGLTPSELRKTRLAV